jgi:hypothetical protein
MTVQEVIDMAKYGELQNLGTSTNVSQILSYLNLGVLELYKRFPLKVEEHIITLVEGQSIYTMPADMMWIVAAYEEVSEDDAVSYTKIIPINKEEDVKSLNTISWNQVQVPLVTNGAYISVIYVAAPETYTENDLEETLEIPLQMVEALLGYMAFRAHSAINSGDEEARVLYQEFEASCDRLLTKGMFNQDDLYMSDRIKDKGFV